MSETQRYYSNDKNNFKNKNNLSRNKNYLETDRNAFNNKVLKNYINTYTNKNTLNIENNKYQNSSINTESNKISNKKINRSNIIKNKSISKFNFDEVMNFNFGLQNPAQLKLINTTMLASPEKNRKNNITYIKHSDKKNSLTYKNLDMKLNQTRYLLGYSLSRKNKNKINKSKKISFLSEDKYFKNKNGMLILPSLTSLYKNNKKIIPKISNNNLNEEKDKEATLIKKCIKEKDFDKIKKIIEKDNEEMKKQISEKYKKMDEKIRKYKLKRPNEETQEGIEKLFEIYNKKRGKENNITTNLNLEKNDNGESLINIQTKEKFEYYLKNRFNNILLDTKGNTRFLLKTEEEKNKPEKLTNFEISTLANRANRKVEKKFPDLCAFNLPKILNENKEYNLKLLYDVFIEFKSLIKCGMVHNKNLNMIRQGIDFDTFFNCNTKINQQGIALSKKIFKAFNNKTNLNFMSWQNYFDGMMKIKDQNIDNKLDLFFQILDENGDGSFDYNEVYNLSLISLQRVLPEAKKKEESENQSKNDDKSEKNEENKNEKSDENKSENSEENDVTHILAEFLTKFVFELVGIDIDGEIPIDLLREKMDEKNEQKEYLEFFLCADNFA